jgi:hypothetical protein
MDRSKKENWSWLPAHMPGVVQLLDVKRAQLGRAHVNECWRRGVVLCLPGYFFAVEGPLAVGTPFGPDTLLEFAKLPGGDRKRMLWLYAGPLPELEGGG